MLDVESHTTRKHTPIVTVQTNIYVVLVFVDSMYPSQLICNAIFKVLLTKERKEIEKLSFCDTERFIYLYNLNLFKLEYYGCFDFRLEPIFETATAHKCPLGLIDTFAFLVSEQIFT